MKSIKSGNWHDPSVWDNQTGTIEISEGHTVTVDKHTPVDNRNVVVKGELELLPGAFIQFINIDESKFIGGGLLVLDTDIGLWIMGKGVLNAVGTYKNPWTWAAGSVKKGSKTYTVKDATGWKVGDTIVISPTRDPGEYQFNYDDKLGIQDKFLPEFERRVITAVSGNTVSFAEALLYDHDEVTDPEKPTVTAPVANLTRDIRIQGTATGRTHIFIHSHVPQKIANIAGRFMGPRKINIGQGRDRPMFVGGRYALHFHHGGQGTHGTTIDNVVFYDCGNRVFVPHMVRGVTFTKCVAFNSLEGQFWWDWQELSHEITYDGCLGMAAIMNGIDSKSESFVLNMGDSNTCKNCVSVYGMNGDESGGGAFSWHANSEGIWRFENNLVIASRAAYWGWQNTGNNHVNRNCGAVNCTISMFWGAYLSPYQWIDCWFINSVTKIIASAANPMGMLFLRCYFNNNGKAPFNVMVQDSPIPSFTTNKLVDCKFRGATVAHVRHFTAKRDTDNDKMHKLVDIVSPDHDGKLLLMDDYTTAAGVFTMLDRNRARVQPKEGQPYQIAIVNRKPVQTNINKFSPTVWGTGQGFKGDYFEGTNFNRYLFSRLDASIQYDSWNNDKNITQTEVHYRIYELTDKDRFSIRWSGFIEGQFTEPYTFKFNGAGGFRLWIDDVLVLNSWFERPYGNENPAFSIPVNLTAGKKHKFIAETFNESGNKGCSLRWKSPSMEEWSFIASSQAYAADSTAPPPVFRSIRKEKSFTRNNCPEGQTGEAYTYVVEAGKYESTVSQSDADAKADTDINSNGQTQANLLGTCKNITMPDPCTTFNAQDYLDLQPDVKAAGYTVDNAIKHYEKYGRTEKRRANKLCLDPTLKPALTTDPDPQPVEKLLFTLNIYSTGRTEVI